MQSDHENMTLTFRIFFITSLAIAVGLVGYSLLGPGGGSQQAHLQAELEKLQEENRELSIKIERQRLEVEGLKTRRDYLEKIVRNELGLIRKDEVVFKFDEKKQADSGQISNNSKNEKQQYKQGEGNFPSTP